MAVNASIFSLLRDSRDPAADHALLEALKNAEPETAQACVETLLLRGNKRSLRGLVASFHLLDKTLKMRLIEEMDRLFGALREAFQSRNDRTRLNVLEIIRLGRVYRVSYLLESAFHDRSKQVREDATDTLYILADELLRTLPVSIDDQTLNCVDPIEIHDHMVAMESHTEDCRQVCGAIEAALACYDLHRQNRVVEVAMWFADQLGPQFWSILTAPGSRTAQAAIHIMTDQPGPRLVPFAMLAMNYSQFRTTVAESLTTCMAPDFLSEWLRQSWRLTRPKFVRAMSAIKELDCTAHHANEIIQLTAEDQRRIPRWILATGLSHDQKIDVLKALFQEGERPGRRAAVWAMVGWRDPRTTTLLRVVAESDDPEFARIAKHELTLRCPREYRLCWLIHEVDGEPAEPPANQTGPITFERYWSMFETFDPAEKLRLGQEMLDHTPSAQGLFARHLAEPEAASRVRALQIIIALGLVEHFADPIYRLSHDSHAEVRSTAMTALGQLPSPTSKRILHNALYDQDERVQANAVESVDRVGGAADAPELIHKLASPNNRVRANAAKALLKMGVREAAVTLLQMLNHEERAHRISALWLIEKMGLYTVAARVQHLAETDSDQRVRTRAKNLVANLDTEQSAESPPAASPRLGQSSAPKAKAVTP